MDSPVRIEDAWPSLQPLVGSDQVDPELIVAGLNSIRIVDGRCERLVRSGATVVNIFARESGVARLTIFVREVPYAIVVVEGDEGGWFMRRLAVRSSIYRMLEAPCRRMKLPIVADPAIHAVRLDWLGHSW